MCQAKTHDYTAAYERARRLSEERPFFVDDGIALYADAMIALERGVEGKTLSGFLRSHLAPLGREDCFAILAYIERCDVHIAVLGARRPPHARASPAASRPPRWGSAALPAFHRAAFQGWANAGVSPQLTWDGLRIPVPGAGHGFTTVEEPRPAAIAMYWPNAGARLLRGHLGADVAAGPDRIRQTLTGDVSLS